ncbi:LacI family transcriptional regulator [Haloactinopolyspora alba]|uniref:LacI family transcriptional regulator n=1 Tax=Haloactinopolyspora alba TaxID=648780 RepID=A0A2P8DT79_9ACTN|nr:LacI family DNA-binding transcriptional regulator [Haloactinopolyspora alba]PSL00418.1 LacI family transcriptional regulator [Haloactinopolyspora alba]
MPTRSGRLTQRDIARLAQVSQTTVSMVLNDRHLPSVRISQETRDRVLRVINETGYVADPVARRLLAQHNQIFGVFTYERVFPSTSADFFHPFLVGIEESSEQLGCDLLLFTSAPTGQGRRIFHENNRLRLADGCILLGREIPADELARLNDEAHPYIAVGRRDDAHGPVPYVGAGYAEATAELVERAHALGHRELAYVGPGGGAESAVDRLRGFSSAGGRRHDDGRRPTAEILDFLLDTGVTAVFAEEHAAATALAETAEARGMRVPAELSVVALGDPMADGSDREFTGFRIPRREMGAQAVDILSALLRGEDTDIQRLLPCEVTDRGTLVPPEQPDQPNPRGR